MFFKKISKKSKRKEASLEEAFEMGLITKGEFLRLKADRADRLLKEYFAPRGGKKK